LHAPPVSEVLPNSQKQNSKQRKSEYPEPVSGFQNIFPPAVNSLSSARMFSQSSLPGLVDKTAHIISARMSGLFLSVPRTKILFALAEKHVFMFYKSKEISKESCTENNKSS